MCHIDAHPDDPPAIANRLEPGAAGFRDQQEPVQALTQSKAA